MKEKPGIYIPVGRDGFELCHPISQGDFERINVEINGTPRQSKWQPISVKLVRNDEGRELVKSDSPWLGAHALIFRSGVIGSIGSILQKDGELLPLTCSEADLLICNPTRVLEALDEAASSVLRFNNGKIMLIQQHVFRADVIRDIDIFKIPDLRVSPTFLSQRFVNQWNESRLKGLDFKRVWTSPN